MPSAPQLTSVCPAADGEVILGVYTHKEFHVATVITALGAPAGSNTFPASRTGSGLC